MPDAARLAAYDVLKAVRVDDEYANLALPGILRARGLSGRDAAFATELAAGTLRGQGTYDASDWDEALSEANDMGADAVEELLEMPMLASVLESGMAAFDLSCDGIGDLS